MFDGICLWSQLVLDFVGRFLITVSLLVICLFVHLFLFGSVLVICTFLRICPFLPGCPFYWPMHACSSLLWSFVFLWCQLQFLLFHLWLYWFELSLFLMGLAKGLSILFIFSKNQLLVSLIFFKDFFPI